MLDVYNSADILLLESMNPDIDDRKRREGVKEYRETRHNCRAMFMGVGHPNGWPADLRTHCNQCDGFHPRFRFEHIHPLLRFLEDTTMCIRGHGAQLIINFDIVNETEIPNSCYEHYCSEVRQVETNLRQAQRRPIHATSVHASDGIGGRGPPYHRQCKRRYPR